MTPLLSILIPTLPERAESMARLLSCLSPQLEAARGGVTVLKLLDDGRASVGAKRQRLLEAARTPYVSFVDDDDLVHPDYVARVLGAIRAGADVVGFKLRRFFDGGLEGIAVHSLRNERWQRSRGDDGLSLYLRTPNHLNPIHRELALSVGYQPMREGEDAEYSRRLYAMHGKTMREEFIDEFLYDYFAAVHAPAPVTMYDDEGCLTYEGVCKVIREGGSAPWRGRMCSTLAQVEA